MEMLCEASEASRLPQKQAVISSSSPVWQNMSELKQGYQFDQKLDDTSLGQVVRALDDHDQLVVIKLSSLEKYQQRLKQETLNHHHYPLIMENPIEEAQLHEWISHHAPHPHILRCLESYQSEDGKTRGLVIEYASNRDLVYEVMGNSDVAKPLPEPRARKLFRQVVSAVHHLHQHGVAHLDISPENIFLDAQGDAKLGDFGVARRVPAQDQFPPHVVFSKRFYMAPEVCHQRDFQPAKADVFSLGVSLLALLSGSLPFLSVPLLYLYMTRAEVAVQLNKIPSFRLLSPDALDLICSTMASEAHRITSAEMLQHPFLQSVQK